MPFRRTIGSSPHDPTPKIRSSYDESPEAHDGQKEDSLWARATARNRSRPQTPRGGGQAVRWSEGPGGGSRARDQREATFHRWRKRYGGTSPQEAKRLKELEKENARLKRLLAEKELDIDLLKEVSRGNF